MNITPHGHNDMGLPTQQDALLMTVNTIARKLLAYTPVHSFDVVVTDCLKMLGEALRLDRVYIWKDMVSPEGARSCVQTYEWVREGVRPTLQDASSAGLSYDMLPSFCSALDAGQCLNALTRQLVPAEQAVLDPQGVQSLLIAPILIDSTRWGFIGVDNCQSAQVFSHHAENMLLTSGVMLASAILRQTTEKQLHQSEELVQALFDSTPLSCSVWNHNFDLLGCNECSVKLFGLESKQDFLTRFYELSPEYQPCGRLSRELVLERVSEAFASGRSEFDWMHLHPSGELLPAHVSLVRICFKNETAVAAYVRDLRELRAQEKQRREAEERTELMLNATPLCCNFWNKDFKNIACNDEAVRLFDLNDQQEYLDHFYDLSPEYQPDGQLSADVVPQKLCQAFAEGYAKFEWMHLKLDGTPVPTEITLIRLLFKNEYFVVGYTRDLREHKAMLAEIQATQQELARARDEALAHSKAKSEFLANMSHEIRTPMNGIIGLSYLALQQSSMPPQLRDYIVKIDTSAKSLLRIINDILDFSKINAGKLDLEHAQFDLAEELEEAIQPLLPSITVKGLDVIFDFSKDIPARLIGDAMRLRQVVLNLMTNAAKFTHAGSILIRVETDTQLASGIFLRFTIADTGVGIAPDYLARLFEAFSQADTSVTRRYGGTGLGLAICKQLVTLMGGTIHVSSTVGVGSTFTFTARFDIAPAEKALHPCQDLDDKMVLIVDDNDISRRVLAQYLRNFGAHVECAGDGREALETFAALACQPGGCYAVVLDWKMPEMSGLEVATRIRAHAGMHTHIIMVTAYDHSMLIDEAPDMGIDVVLTKPVTPAALHDALIRAARTKAPHPNDDTASAPLPRAESPLAGKRVLLAEDNEINRMITIELLACHGMIVTEALTGVEAVSRALSTPFDVILMDIQMPEMDGIEATRILRDNHPNLNNTPIIAMTAHAMEGDYEKSITAGMQGHLTKPIDPDTLYATLLHWTSQPAGTARADSG